MAVFSTNQNRQFYVASAFSANITNESAKGSIGGVKCINDGLNKEFYFLYKGPENVLKSDRIQLKNFDYAKALKPSDMIIPLKKVKVALSSEAHGGKPISGQDYVLRIAFRQFYGMSDEDQYFKDAAVHAISAMTDAKALFDEMKKALDLAFSRESGATKDSNPYLSFSVEGTGDNAKLVITEKIQDFAVGIGAPERVYFDVVPTTVYDSAEDVIWGVVTDATPAKMVVDEESEDDPQPLIPNADLVAGTNAIGNGAQLANMEWFYLGERGDQYRMQGWPNYIPTDLNISPNKEYFVLELHYAFTDTGVNSYRSEKDITIVAEQKGTINSLISAINNATGLTIESLGE